MSVTKKRIEENKKKQLILRNNGINVKIDGSWGPWQEKQYRKVIASRTSRPNLANAAVLALPAAGYGIAQLLEGVESLTLPTVSASSMAMAAPIALTLSGPAYGAYELATGLHHNYEVLPLTRQANVYASDATRVNRPIAISTPVKNTLTRLLGEMFVNPVLTRSNRMPIELDLESIENSINNSNGSTSVAPPATPPATPPEKPNKEKKNDKKAPKKVSEKGFKAGAKKVGKNILGMYGKILTGMAYATGVSPLAIAGYAAYKYFKPKPSTTDLLLKDQDKRILELDKLKKAKRLQEVIDSLIRDVQNHSSLPRVDDTVTTDPPKPSTRLKSIDEIADSLNRLL